MKTLNLNSIIKFRLNDRGRDIYYHQYDELNEMLIERGAKPIVPTYPKEDENGFSSFQLWRFMNIYGPYMIMGAPEFWKDMNIYIEDDELKDVP